MTPGDCIGPYRLIAPLGRGGMGEVFAAVHERMNQPVALKLLTRVEPACAARFIQEARALSLLDHPGVVRVLFLGETDEGVPYLVLEQVAGRSLREHLRERSFGLPGGLALSLIAQAATAMAAVHRVGIVHRDLKPENILVVQRLGAPDSVKIIDFGIARVPPLETVGRDTRVETGEDGPRWLGTAAYMAPEQCRHGIEIGPAADVYALGVVLYEALLGRLPFIAHDPVELAAMHLQATPDLSALDSSALRRLVRAMLAKAPEARPSMMAVAVALAELASPDMKRRTLTLSGVALAGAGALLLVSAEKWAGSALRWLLANQERERTPIARDGHKDGISLSTRRPSGLILIAHMEKGSVTQSEMLATLPPEYQHLPQELVTTPGNDAAEHNDFATAGKAVAAWFKESLEPILSRHPDYRVIYFGVAPIPLIFYLGSMLGTLPPVEVRLRHHGERRFVPWSEASRPARLLPVRWSRERSDSEGDVVVRLSTSHLVNGIAARNAVSKALCEVDLRLAVPSEDVFQCQAQVAEVAQAWKQLLDELTQRFRQVRRVHLFASVQAGLAFLLGTQVSPRMHPPIMTYHYRGGVYQPALAINLRSPRSVAPQ